MTCIAVVALAAEGGKFNPLDPGAWSMFLWTLLIFLVSVPFLWKIVFGPITAALEVRDQKAEDAIARANEAQAGAEKARVETQAELSKAREEARRQIQEARAVAERQKRELLEQAKREADQERAKALAEIEAEKRRALVEIRDTVVDLSLQAAGRLMAKEFTAEDQKTLVRGFIDESRTATLSGSSVN